MKIRKLAIRNVASIESAELDFEGGALGDASLFLVCGETGAGKTTILDCITLALYGKTPRYDGGKVKGAQEIGGYGFNDVRQLVRRGAASASATLSLIGNDGKPYEAEWSVAAFSRGASKGTLKAASWRWRDCSPGGGAWTQARECAAAAERATGLGFEQFCRTTMLAQGQFTKFLVGSDDDKAEILEKLTDTSKYSELGKAIAAKWTKLDSDLKTLEADIGKMAGLGDAREQVLRRIGELSDRIAGLGKRREEETAKLRWLQRRGELESNAESVKGGLVAEFAALKALERKISEGVRRATERVEALKAFLAGAADRAAMYESADVILQALADVRKARDDKAAAEQALETCRRGLPALAEKAGAAKAALGKAIRDIAAAEETATCEEKKLEALDRDGAQKSRNEAEKVHGDLRGLQERINGFKKMVASVSSRERSLAARNGELAELEGRLPALKSEMERAREASARARKNRDDQKKLVDDGIDALVADLKVGDACPICGNTIERLHAKGHFEALFRKLDAGCAEAESACAGKERLYNEAAASMDALTKAIAAERGLIAGEGEKIAKERASIADAAGRCGIHDAFGESVTAAVGACAARIAALDLRLAEIGKQEKKVKGLQRELKGLREAKDNALAGVSAAEREIEALKNQIKLHETSIKTEGERAGKKLADVSEKVSEREWLVAWEADAASAEKALKAAAGEYAARKAELPRLENVRDALVKSMGQAADCVKRAVGKVASLGEAGAVGAPAESTAAMDGLLGRYEESRTSMERHLAARPEGLADADTEQALAERVASLKAEEDEAIDERGRCQQQIHDDDRRAAERRQMREKAAGLKAERDEWIPIYSHFGDSDGKKIRREMQSYVLANVLVKANYYLRQLSNRYELSCEGLTLSVNDAFEAGAARPVNTLSGGEQFLVSLALALGLAGMSDTGLGVDMLLIDEGFGTLSGEHLNSAIEALERLNALAGSRKVGVISHVERLRERIRTHVEVTRSGQGPSEVRVVANSPVG